MGYMSGMFHLGRIGATDKSSFALYITARLEIVKFYTFFFQKTLSVRKNNVSCLVFDFLAAKVVINV